jgi:hypothetical protein
LWKAGRLGEKRWFIAILVINTIGLLEIIYLFTQNKNKLRTILIIPLAVFVTIAVVALSGGNVVQIKSYDGIVYDTTMPDDTTLAN